MRPYVGAILEAQPLPAITYGLEGRFILPNSAAEHLLSTGSDGVRRVFAQDGTDVWTIVAARSDEAAPFFDIRLRLRGEDGHSFEASMSVAPLRGAGGVLAGAVVFVLSIPAERMRSGESSDRTAPRDDFGSITTRLGRLLGAARTYVVEVDRDFRSEGSVLAWWADDGSPVPVSPFRLSGTPADSFSGRKVTFVPAGLAAMYPDDPLLTGGEYESYVGVALSNDDGEQIGLLAGVWSERLLDVPGTLAVFTIMARDASIDLRDMIAKRELRESEQRYGSVFSGSAVPIVLLEPVTTQVVDANPAACNFYGYPRDEFMTMSILQLDVMGGEAVQVEIERALDGSRGKFVGRHLLAGARVRDVEVSIGPIVVSGRRLLYLMVNDITERKRMEAELERSRRSLETIVAQRTEDLLRANAELQQASMARDMVFVNLAQELRTSLQTVTGFSDLLLEGLAGALTEEQHRQIEMIQQAGKRLAVFATSLIETQRLEESEPVLDLEEFDIVSLVESVLFGLVSFAEDKGLTLEMDAADRPLTVVTDRYKVQQILLNLLSNAVRYTERGGITVTVARLADGSDSVAVADTGPGLPPARLEALFNGPEVHGTASGIGLPASLRIAALLGGTLEAESVPTRGSIFTLKLGPGCTVEPGRTEE